MLTRKPGCFYTFPMLLPHVQLYLYGYVRYIDEAPRYQYITEKHLEIYFGSYSMT